MPWRLDILPGHQVTLQDRVLAGYGQLELQPDISQENID